MRGIPGTITQYGIENTVAPVPSPSPAQYIVKVTYRDGTVAVLTNEGKPYSADEVDTIVGSLNNPEIKASLSVTKVLI